MKTFATSRENTTLQVDDSAITVMWKEFPVWEVKAKYIKRIDFNGRDQTMEVSVNVNGEEEKHLTELPKQSYEDVKVLFTENLDGVRVRSLSRMQQLLLPLIMLVIVLILTSVMLFLSSAFMLTKMSDYSNWLADCCHFLAENLGFVGILIIGAILMGLLALLILKRYLFPKQASLNPVLPSMRP